MMDYEEYDLTPYDEESVQINECDSSKFMRLEYKAIVAQLVRMFGDPMPHQVSFGIVANPHDFGTYYGLKMFFNEWNDYTQRVENEWPKYWDDEAKLFLAQNGYYDRNL